MLNVLMPSIANKPYMMSVIVLSVVMLNVVVNTPCYHWSHYLVPVFVKKIDFFE